MPYADKTKLRVHRTWQNMMWRCYRAEHAAYKYYGGRGVEVCEEWHKFEPFYRWALNNGYASNLTIDRIDVNGDYCPENCRWVTMRVQANNKRTSHYVSYKGETKSVSEWAKLVGISRQAMAERLASPNWSIEEAVTTPAHARPVKQPLLTKKVRQLSFDKEVVRIWDSISEAAKALNIHNENISRALKTPRYTAGGCYWEYV